MAIRMKDEEFFSVELTPMIDVVFLLIIFFLVATTFQQLERELAVKVPETKSADSGQGKPDPIVVNVVKEEQGFRLVVDGNTVTLDQLRSILSKAVAAEPEIRAVIRADKEVLHGETVQVYDACRLASVAFSVATREKKE